MKILQAVKKCPGGLMIVPLLLGALVNTCAPQLWVVFKGTFTTYLWKTGAMPLLAAFLFCNGTTIDVKQAGTTLTKGIVLTAVKVLVGMGIGVAVSYTFGEAGIFGLAPIAIIAAIANSNGGCMQLLLVNMGMQLMWVLFPYCPSMMALSLRCWR